jgi:hypothetical protein
MAVNALTARRFPPPWSVEEIDRSHQNKVMIPSIHSRTTRIEPRDVAFFMRLRQHCGARFSLADKGDNHDE